MKSTYLQPVTAIITICVKYHLLAGSDPFSVVGQGDFTDGYTIHDEDDLF